MSQVVPISAVEGAGAPGAARRPALAPEVLRVRELLAKVGSGEHTSTGLTRAEAREATDLMLLGPVSDAQLGAFLIAHRIRRPSPLELAGMLDSYRQHGPVLRTPGQRPLCFGVPYDGRSRTAPLLPLLALLLAAAGQPVVLHGGDPMPVKYGISLAELFAVLGIDWRRLSLADLQQRLAGQGLALAHQPCHFPAAERLLPIREAIGKRPPVASLELLWTPHQGEHLLVSGFVHPPTEARAWEALAHAGETDLLTVKGLEGSTDLPTSRAGITARGRESVITRLLVHPRDHGLCGPEVAWQNLELWREQALAALLGEGPLAEPLLWNLGVYLWLAERCDSLPAGLEQARALLAARCGEKLRQDLAT